MVFLHGYSAISPGFYYYWILHLVKKGSVVVYPYYQGNFSVGVNKMYSNAVTGVKNAMKILYAEGISVENGIGLIGHSLGGVFAAALAVDWRIFNLPFPRFVFSVEPGAGFAIFYKDYRSIPAFTLLVTLAGDMDLVVGSATADEIFSQGGAQRKCEIFLRSESRGDFSLVADHFAPLASEKFINAFDWYGFWKWSVALMDCAYYNKYCDYVLEDSANARFMGKWSDGKSVKEPIFDCRK